MMLILPSAGLADNIEIEFQIHFQYPAPPVLPGQEQETPYAM